MIKKFTDGQGLCYEKWQAWKAKTTLEHLDVHLPFDEVHPSRER